MVVITLTIDDKQGPSGKGGIRKGKQRLAGNFLMNDEASIIGSVGSAL